MKKLLLVLLGFVLVNFTTKAEFKDGECYEGYFEDRVESERKFILDDSEKHNILLGENEASYLAGCFSQKQVEYEYARRPQDEKDYNIDPDCYAKRFSDYLDKNNKKRIIALNQMITDCVCNSVKSYQTPQEAQFWNNNAVKQYCKLMKNRTDKILKKLNNK